MCQPSPRSDSISGQIHEPGLQEVNGPLPSPLFHRLFFAFPRKSRHSCQFPENGNFALCEIVHTGREVIPHFNFGWNPLCEGIDYA